MCAKVMSPGRRFIKPSAMLFDDGSVTGWPASSDFDIFGAPIGSTATMRTDGFDSLIAAATPDAMPAAADRHEHGADVRALLENLEAHRALADDDLLVIERRHDRQAARAASFSARVCRSSDVVPSMITSAP